MDASNTEEELKRVRNELQAVLDNVPAYIYQIDANGHYVFANRAYLKLIGWNLDNLVGRPVTDVFPEDEARSFLANNRAILESGETSEFTESAELADGTHVYSSVKTPLFGSDGKALAILGISTDITDRVRSEEALKESDRRKDEFLAILGHELRNPLAPLSTGVELLKQANGKPEAVEGVRGMMKRQLTHLTRLVDDLVDIARINRGQIQLQRRRVDLNEVLDSAVDQVRSKIADRGHQLIEQRTQTPLLVNGDAERLTQVTVNLLTNAVKYMEEGGTITLSTDADNGQAVVRVKDTGYGIPREDLDSIFQMFKQVGEHQDRTGGSGLGIGLALCRRLVEMHDGTIEARSAGTDRGTEFIVRLPLA